MLTLGSSVFDTWPYEPKSHRNCWSHSYASNWSIASPSSIVLGAPDFLTAALATVPMLSIGKIALRPCKCPGHSVPKVEVARDGFHGDCMRGAQGRQWCGPTNKKAEPIKIGFPQYSGACTDTKSKLWRAGCIAAAWSTGPVLSRTMPRNRG